MKVRREFLFSALVAKKISSAEGPKQLRLQDEDKDEDKKCYLEADSGRNGRTHPKFALCTAGE